MTSGFDSGNELSLNKRQFIPKNNAEKLIISPAFHNLRCVHIHYTIIYIQANTFGNVVWKMAAILSRLLKTEFPSDWQSNSFRNFIGISCCINPLVKWILSDSIIRHLTKYPSMLSFASPTSSNNGQISTENANSLTTKLAYSYNTIQNDFIFYDWY